VGQLFHARGMAVAVVVGERSALRVSIESGDLRMLNVCQPWAAMLVGGYTPIENRGTGSNAPCPQEWVAIVASQSAPRAADIASVRTALGPARSEAALSPFASGWPAQAIVGLVRFSRVLQPNSPWVLGNPWHIPGQAAWLVDACCAFASPISDVPGAESIRRLCTVGANLRERLQSELQLRLPNQ